MLADFLKGVGPDRPLTDDEARDLARSAVCLTETEGYCEDFSLAGGAAEGTVFVSDAECDDRGMLPPGDRYVCAIGAFDGLHLGHRALLARAAEEAGSRGCRLVALTFDPDPSRLFGGPSDRDLIAAGERRRWLQAAGVGCVAVCRFTPALAALSHERFVREVLCGLGRLEAIVVGFDFKLGARGAGTVPVLAQLGREMAARGEGGFDVVGVDLAGAGGAPITATRIRGLLAEGAVEDAAGLLGRCHSVAGVVEHGRGEGTAFGFPTANVSVDEGLELPAEGVYAGQVVVPGRGPGERARAYAAAINVGKPPTFVPGGAGARFLEATLVGFEGDLYGTRVAVTFARWLRPSRPFDSIEELERTVLGNVDWAASTLGAHAREL